MNAPVDESFVVNISNPPLVTNDVHQRAIDAEVKDPTTYTFPPLSTATALAQSILVPPALLARR
jgi:hypothetical protein